MSPPTFLFFLLTKDLTYRERASNDATWERYRRNALMSPTACGDWHWVNHRGISIFLQCNLPCWHMSLFDSATRANAATKKQNQAMWWVCISADLQGQQCVENLSLCLHVWCFKPQHSTGSGDARHLLTHFFLRVSLKICDPMQFAWEVLDKCFFFLPKHYRAVLISITMRSHCLPVSGFPFIM